MVYLEKAATAEDIQDLINWLETKTGTYDAGDPYQCAVAQYLRDRGHTYVRFDGLKEVNADGNEIVLPEVIVGIAYGDGASQFNSFVNKQRFSDALARARTVHVDMTYGIKPSEDPGASNEEANRQTDPIDPLYAGDGTEATKDDDVS